MEWLILIVALTASALTLFSGFGLGTLLLPAFALVFPLEVAVAATAVVHLANNVWKALLLGFHASIGVVIRFGIPAMLAAFLGAFLLIRMPTKELVSYQLGGTHTITALGLVVGLLIIAFALFDLVPRLKTWSVSAKHLPLGGALSGFFGGLSGHQGALRSVFLTKLGLNAKTFVATGVFCAILVDVSRLAVYGADFWTSGQIAAAGGTELVALACVAAFAGAIIGKQMLGKTTMDGVRTLVGTLLLLIGTAIAAGLV